MTLQDLELKGDKVRYTWKKTFNTIAKYTDRQLWLPLLNALQNQIIRATMTIEEMKQCFFQLYQPQFLPLKFDLQNKS